MDIERLKEWANTQNIGTANMSYHKAQEHVLEIIDEANQSATSEEVAEAIDFMKKEVKMLENWVDRTGDFFDKNLAMFKTILTALQAYRPKPTSEEVAEAISHIQGGYGDVWQWPKKRRDTIITALQQYQPKGETL